MFGKVDLEIWVYQEGPPTGGTFSGVLEFPCTLCALCGAHAHIWAPTDTIFNFAPYSSRKWLDW